MESLEVERSFWEGKRVFLTGHTGFKGSWLSLWLSQLGAEVTGYSLEPESTPNLFEIAQVGKTLKSIIGDVRDAVRLKAELIKANPEIVIHMAAQPLVRLSYEKPLETYETNVMGTANLLNAVRNAENVRSVVIITTDKVYENREWDWAYREIDPLGGFDPYSNSKAATELVVSAFRNSYFHEDKHSSHGVSIATARAGNVFGGGDWSADRLIPDIFRAFFSGELPVIRNPTSIRPWQLVLEPLRGYLMLARGLHQSGRSYSGAYNFGPDSADAMSVEWIVKRVGTILGKNPNWNTSSDPQPHEAKYLKLDISKANSVLGWKPQVSLESGLEIAAAWYIAQHRGEAMKKYSLNAINQYIELSSS